MKFQNPFFLFICLSVAIYCTDKRDKEIASAQNKISQNHCLIVERGAFHYDKFVMKNNSISYIPDSTSIHQEIKYNNRSKTTLDSISYTSFFKEIEEKGFWELKNRYETYSSCTSELKVTFSENERTKTVICDDYERHCPDLLKYIEEKLVELEGNDLKRIYLPG